MFLEQPLDFQIDPATARAVGKKTEGWVNGGLGTWNWEFGPQSRKPFQHDIRVGGIGLDPDRLQAAVTAKAISWSYPRNSRYWVVKLTTD